MTAEERSESRASAWRRRTFESTVRPPRNLHPAAAGAEAMTAPNTDLVRHMLDALETLNRELTKWEEDFVASVSEQFAQRGSISERQAEILERIYAEKTA